MLFGWSVRPVRYLPDGSVLGGVHVWFLVVSWLQKSYIVSHEPKSRPDCIYFSLGDKEAKTRNPILKTVQENAEEIWAFYQSKGIDTVFQLNPGNHFVPGNRADGGRHSVAVEQDGDSLQPSFFE